VNSTSGALTFTGAGNCVVRATAAATATYSQATKDVTFVVSLTPLEIATNAVVLAEGSNLPTDVDAAQALITALANSAAKTALQDRLDIVKARVSPEVAILNAFNAVSTATSQTDVDSARTLVNNLPNGVVKNLLGLQLNAIQATILANVTLAVTAAEASKLQVDVIAVQASVTALPASSEKTALQGRIDTLQTLLITEATAAVVTAEGNPTPELIATAQGLVDNLPDGSAKSALQLRINALAS
jgi:hypothetical protein